MILKLNDMLTIFWKIVQFSFFGALVVALGLGYGAYQRLSNELPDIETLKNVPLPIPLKILTQDEQLIAEYGHKRRTTLTYEQIPPLFLDAIVATEDQRFFEHHGVDFRSLVRAFVSLVATGRKSQGGSTITMQVARNYFLSPERTYTRKIKEILLAFRIEQNLTKEDILTLYLNKIFLGNRAYGIAAAAEVYYGMQVSELELAQVAMLAGLPKAPSKINPLFNPVAAKKRRDYVLKRMLAMGVISEEAFAEANLVPISAQFHGTQADVEAPYVAESVRQLVVEAYGTQVAYNQGLRIYTSIESRLQQAANGALQKHLMAYDHRHGYKGPIGHISLSSKSKDKLDWLEKLSEYPSYDLMEPALVLTLAETSAVILTKSELAEDLLWPGMQWARAYINDNRLGPEPTKAKEIVKEGDVIYVSRDASNRRLMQVPEVSGALVAMSSEDGAVKAMVGGFDYAQSQFNRATLALRQPGSNFKPFIYSAALDSGFTAATMVNDSPVVFEDALLESYWRPENYSGQFFGPTPIRMALAKSRNLVSIRLLQAIGISKALKHVARFGFDADTLPRNLSLALGSGEVTPMALAAGYAAFANGGFKVQPHLIKRIEDSSGRVIYDYKTSGCPLGRCYEGNFTERERAVSAGNAYIMTSMMQDVIKVGTGRQAQSLERIDLAGKTGTTNDQTDAWFSGFTPDLVATVWVGFDAPRPLGHNETGGQAALPMWIDFMQEALSNTQEKPFLPPPTVVHAKIDPETGLLASSYTKEPRFEIFEVGKLPEKARKEPSVLGASETMEIPEQIF